MSKMLLYPNYCSCTVHQARNLPEKGKHGGVDAFCTISMGKEKFMTAVREKTRSPDWQEQCDMPVADDATIKLTVYHQTKNALSKGDFIGRAYVSIRDLQDYDRVHRSWFKLLNKDGKADKERGEIDVSLQFYSKNNTTGSVLDLATKKKHLSLKEIKHSLGSKLKSASKHRKDDKYAGDNQLADQRRRLGGGEDSTFNVRDFLDDSASESASFAGSHMSLNSMSFNNNGNGNGNQHHSDSQSKKITRAPSSGLGSTLGTGTGTPQSSRRSVTSDYDTSSILDSASMYGGDEPSTPSPPVRSQQTASREVYVGEDLPPRSNSTRKKKSKESTPTTIPTINEPVRSASVTADDIEAAFDAINDYRTSTKEHDFSSPDSLFGLSTIKETTDNDDTPFTTRETKKNFRDEDSDDIDFDNCFDQYKQKQEQQEQHLKDKLRQEQDAKEREQQQQQLQQKHLQEQQTKQKQHEQHLKQKQQELEAKRKQRLEDEAAERRLIEENQRKAAAAAAAEAKKESKRAAPEPPRPSTVTIVTPRIETPATPVASKNDSISSQLDDENDSIDEDVDELLGKLERMSSIRSSVKRKIQPKVDLMQQSFSELDSPANPKFGNGFPSSRNSGSQSTALPDIVGEQSLKGSSSTSNAKKATDQGLSVLGYDNVKTVSVQPKVREELDYLDREELLQVIAFQTDLLKKRDTRLKDLENYTDTLLVKILEQCPTILQVGASSSTSSYR